MSNAISQKNIEKLNSLMNVNPSKKFEKGFKKNILYEKNQLLKNVKIDAEREVTKLSNNLPLLYDEYGSEPEIIAYDTYAYLKLGVSALSSSFIGYMSYNSTVNSNNLNNNEIAVFCVTAVLTIGFLVSAMEDLKKHNEMKKHKLLISVIDKCMAKKEIKLEDLDKLYNSEYKDIVLLMASMDNVEARKVRYKNYLESYIRNEICRRVCEPEDNSSF